MQENHPSDHDSASDSDARRSRLPASPPAPAELASTDPLSEVLRGVRLTGAVFFRWDVSWPYALAVPEGRAFAFAVPGCQQVVSYHVVTEGHCFGGLLGAPAVRLEVGDVLFVPRGHAYAIGSSPEECQGARVELEPALDFFRQMAAGALPPVVVDGGGGPTFSRLICGFLGCDELPFNPVMQALPALSIVRSPAHPDSERLTSLVSYALDELQAPTLGSRSVLLQLSELMFMEVVRRSLHEPQGWIAALGHPIAGSALRALHQAPAAPWTLATLAERIGSSRSALADCFTRVVGQPPMQYLARWRMQLASRQLSDSGSKVSAIARQVGYESEAAFSRAFKRWVGVAPAEWRRGGGR